MAKSILDKSGNNDVYEVSFMDGARGRITKKTVVCFDAQ